MEKEQQFLCRSLQRSRTAAKRLLKKVKRTPGAAAKIVLKTSDVQPLKAGNVYSLTQNKKPLLVLVLCVFLHHCNEHTVIYNSHFTSGLKDLHLQ